MSHCPQEYKQFYENNPPAPPKKTTDEKGREFIQLTFRSEKEADRFLTNLAKKTGRIIECKYEDGTTHYYNETGKISKKNAKEILQQRAASSAPSSTSTSASASTPTLASTQTSASTTPVPVPVRVPAAQHDKKLVDKPSSSLKEGGNQDLSSQQCRLFSTASQLRRSQSLPSPLSNDRTTNSNGIEANHQLQP